MSIGLCGPAGCGKNEVGRLLEKYFGRKQASFAEALRCEVATVTIGGSPIPLEILMSPPLWKLALNLWTCKRKQINPWIKPTSKPMRIALQMWGSEYRRSQNMNYWVDRAPRGHNLVYTDVRFQNETLICSQIWYIWRPAAEQFRGKHISECSIRRKDCDAVIDNSGSLEDLDNKFRRVAELKNKRG